MPSKHDLHPVWMNLLSWVAFQPAASLSGDFYVSVCVCMSQNEWVRERERERDPGGGVSKQKI